MTYNRHDAANAMLTEIEDWCKRTGTRENVIGHVLFLHPGFVGLMRARRTLSEEKEIAVRDFLYCQHPDGYRGDLPKTHANGTRPVKRSPSKHSAKICLERGELPTAKLTEAEIAQRRVDRDACTYCGVRADVGCKHRPWRLNHVSAEARI
jgi:hypothetical protein